MTFMGKDDTYKDDTYGERMTLIGKDDTYWEG